MVVDDCCLERKPIPCRFPTTNQYKSDDYKFKPSIKFRDVGVWNVAARWCHCRQNGHEEGGEPSRRGCWKPIRNWFERTLRHPERGPISLLTTCYTQHMFSEPTQKRQSEDVEVLKNPRCERRRKRRCALAFESTEGVRGLSSHTNMSPGTASTSRCFQFCGSSLLQGSR